MQHKYATPKRKVAITRVLEPVQTMVCDFFMVNTHVLSGAKRKTRVLAMKWFELMAEFHARWPALLRKLAKDRPDTEHPTNSNRAPTKLQKGILLAVAGGQKEGFDECQEYEIRKGEYMAGWAFRLVLVDSSDDDLADSPAREGDDEDDDPGDVPLGSSASASSAAAPAAPEVEKKQIVTRPIVAFSSTLPPPKKPVLSEPNSIDSSTLREILKQHEVAFTHCTHETRCPLHDNGPVWEAQLVGVTIELANIEPRDPRRPALLKKKRDLDADIAVYKLHLAQYEVQRRHIAKTIEGLKVGECVIFRDFVNMYSDANDQGTNQVKNLQLVLLETQSCNSHYVADVFEYLLHHPDEHHWGFLRKFHKIFICGDHGPHFSSKETMYNESTFQEKYGIEVETVFLCSYHAFNRCDAAGVELKRLIVSAAKQRLSYVTSVDFALLMNRSQYLNHVAVPYAKISGNISTFPTTILRRSATIERPVTSSTLAVEWRSSGWCPAGPS